MLTRVHELKSACDKWCPFQRQEFVRLNEEIHVLGSHFVQGTQMANAIEKRRLPQHIQHSFVVDGDNVTIGSLYADNPSDLVRLPGTRSLFPPCAQGCGDLRRQIPTAVGGG